MDLFGGLPVGQVGLLGALVLTPWGLLAFVVRKILAGELVPRQQLVDEQADNTYLRTALDTQQQIALKQGMTLERLIVLGETSNQVIGQIQAGLFRPEGQYDPGAQGMGQGSP